VQSENGSAQAYICNYIRTPIGRFGCALEQVRRADRGYCCAGIEPDREQARARHNVHRRGAGDCRRAGKGLTS
jgi:hypothetical protein